MDTTNKKNSKAQMGIASLIMSVIISVPLLFRGLYFESELSFFGIIASLFVFAALILKKEKLYFNPATDIPLCAITLFYMISAFTAVNTGSALLELVKYVLLLIIYFGVKAIIAGEMNIRKALVAFASVIALSSLISLLTASGLVNYNGSYSATEIERWLNGTVQYHNAFGILCVAGFFITAGMFSEATVKKAGFYVSSLLSYLLMFGVIMSYSRGAWVMVPFVFIVYMIFADKAPRISVFVWGIASLISVIAVLGGFSANVLSENTGMCILYLLAGLIITTILGALLNLALTFWSRTKHFKISATAVCAVIILAAGAVLLVPSITALLPQQLAQRISGINFSSETVTERFVFYADAWKIAQRNLITGSGGGAWADLYGMYQSYNYSSSQAHSYIMQLLVESGIPGLLAFLATIVTFFVTSIRLLIKKKASRDILCAITSAAAALIIHSFIDFDLSIFAISVMLWCMLAFISSLDTPARRLSIHGPSTYAVCVIMAVVWLFSYISVNAYNSGLTLFAEEKYEEAYKKFSVASSLNPSNSIYLSQKSLACVKHSKNAELRKNSVDDFEAAINMAPYNAETVQNGVSLYSATGAYLSALDYTRRAIELQPKNLDCYLAYIQSVRDVTSHYMQKGAYNNALEAVTDAINIGSLAEENGVELTDSAKQILSYIRVVYYNLSGKPVD